MPWTARDAKRHIKGLTPKGARTWAHVANSALARCLASGGSQSECEGRAIRQANSVAGKTKPSTNATPQLWTHEAIVTHAEHLMLQDRDYLTCPVTMIVAGVLNNGLVDTDALEPLVWQGIPVVINHPCDADGTPVSARTPDILETYGIGHVYHARMGTGTRAGHTVPSLIAELWIDVERAKALGGEALQALQMIELHQPLEVSTAFYSDAERTPGSFYGTPYAEIHHNLRPDHLALLPNGIGACSLEHGCGVPRVHEQECTCPDPATCTCEETPVPDTPPLPLLQRFWAMARDMLKLESSSPPADASHAAADPETTPALTVARTDLDLRAAIESQMYAEMGQNVYPCYVRDVDMATNSFTYQHGPQLMRRYWTMVDDVLTLLPNSEVVQPSTTYIGVPDEDDEEDEEPMANQAVPPVTIKTHANWLIANGATTGWHEEHRHLLEAMDEAALIVLRGLPKAQPPPEPHVPSTLAEALELVPAQFRETLSDATVSYQRHKTKLIETLVNNATNPFSREELDTMTASRLEQLVMMAGEDLPDQHARHQPQNYSGRRMPQLRIERDEEDTVPPPPDTLGLVVQRQRDLGLRI